ncbi:MAG: cell division protein SepF [Symbiobacteriia bacterium]
MAKRFWDRLLGLIGFEMEEVEEEDDRSFPPPTSRDPVVEEWVEDLPHGGKKRGTLVSLPGQKQVKVVVVEPRSFEEVQSIADHLKSRRPIILNLEVTDKEQAQRILNFLSGCIYALGGEMQRISNGIFFFAPSNVDIALMRRTKAETAAPTAADKADNKKPAVGFGGGLAKDLGDRKSGLNVPMGIGRDADDSGDRGIGIWNK